MQLCNFLQTPNLWTSVYNYWSPHERLFGNFCVLIYKTLDLTGCQWIHINLNERAHSHSVFDRRAPEEVWVTCSPLSAGGPAVKVPSSREILQGVLKKLPKSKRFRQHKWETTARKRLRITMRVPFVCRLFNIKRNLLKKAKCALLNV